MLYTAKELQEILIEAKNAAYLGGDKAGFDYFYKCIESKIKEEERS
jgi:hypothetical protein